MKRITIEIPEDIYKKIGMLSIEVDISRKKVIETIINEATEIKECFNNVKNKLLKTK